MGVKIMKMKTSYWLASWRHQGKENHDPFDHMVHFIGSIWIHAPAIDRTTRREDMPKSTGQCWQTRTIIMPSLLSLAVLHAFMPMTTKSVNISFQWTSDEQHQNLRPTPHWSRPYQASNHSFLLTWTLDSTRSSLSARASLMKTSG